MERGTHPRVGDRVGVAGGPVARAALVHPLVPWYGGGVNEWPVILFDGECNLCSATVRFVMRRERAPWCRFAALQSESGRRLVREAGGDPAALDTFYLKEGDRLLARSDAALAVARHLRWPWRAAGGLRALPRGWRDALYNFVARNRYRWFGRHAFCAIPDRVDAGRFLS